MITHRCDKCNATVEQKKGERAKAPEGWLGIRPRGYSTTWEYEICPDCIKALGIPEDGREQTETVARQLIELISDIAQEAVEQ